MTYPSGSTSGHAELDPRVVEMATRLVDRMAMWPGLLNRRDGTGDYFLPSGRDGGPYTSVELLSVRGESILRIEWFADVGDEGPAVGLDLGRAADGSELTRWTIEFARLTDGLREAVLDVDNATDGLIWHRLDQRLTCPGNAPSAFRSWLYPAPAVRAPRPSRQRSRPG